MEYLDTVKAYDMKLKLQDFYSRHKDYDEKTIFDVSDHVNQPKERSGKITKYCVHVF